MKKIFLLFILLPCCHAIQAQMCPYNYLITFDSSDMFYLQLLPPADTMYLSNQHWISVDTANYHRNQWQVGRPAKTVFNAAYSLPDAIVTDTLHPVQPNDTSVFTLKVPKFAFDGFCQISFHYRLNIDSGDKAIIEFSTDTGVHWTNILFDTVGTVGLFSFGTDTPHLHSSTVGWDSLFLSGIGGTYWNSIATDTFLFRFTYIADSDTAARDGWMIDNIKMGYAGEGAVKEVNDNSVFGVFPNPAYSSLTITSSAKGTITHIAITNLPGQTLFTHDYNSDKAEVDVADLPPGIYFIKINGTEVRKFVKE